MNSPLDCLGKHAFQKVKIDRFVPLPAEILDSLITLTFIGIHDWMWAAASVEIRLLLFSFFTHPNSLITGNSPASTINDPVWTMLGRLELLELLLLLRVKNNRFHKKLVAKQTVYSLLTWTTLLLCLRRPMTHGLVMAKAAVLWQLAIRFYMFYKAHIFVTVFLEQWWTRHISMSYNIYSIAKPNPWI